MTVGMLQCWSLYRFEGRLLTEAKEMLMLFQLDDEIMVMRLLSYLIPPTSGSGGALSEDGAEDEGPY